MTSNKSNFRQFVAAIFAAFNKSRVRRILAGIFVAFAIFLLGGPVAAQQDEWFVDDDIAPGGDGETWSTAFENLQDALDEAEDSLATDLIKIAQGVYEPSLESPPGDPDPRTKTFLIDFNFVTIEGGYAGINEPDPDVRDVATYLTKLGSIGSPFLDNNVYHTITIQNVDITVRIDGVWRQAGDAAEPTAPIPQGGGMLIVDADPLIVDCLFIRNVATDGGHVAAFDGSPRFINCRFLEGSAGGNGGGIFTSGASVTLINCIFTGCSAGADGGAIYNGELGHSIIVNSTQSLNTSYGGGAGGVHNKPGFNAGGATITNSILWGNSVPQIDGARAIVTYSDIEGGHVGQGNLDTDPLFLDPDGPDDVAGSPDDDVRLALGSPVNDFGNNDALAPDIADLDGDGDLLEVTPLDLGFLPRVAVDANPPPNGPCDPATVDTGAHENADCQPDGVRDEDELSIASRDTAMLRSTCERS